MLLHYGTFLRAENREQRIETYFVKKRQNMTSLSRWLTVVFKKIQLQSQLQSQLQPQPQLQPQLQPQNEMLTACFKVNVII